MTPEQQQKKSYPWQHLDVMQAQNNRPVSCKSHALSTMCSVYEIMLGHTHNRNALQPARLRAYLKTPVRCSDKQGSLFYCRFDISWLKNPAYQDIHEVKHSRRLSPAEKRCLSGMHERQRPTLLPKEPSESDFQQLVYIYGKWSEEVRHG